MADHVYVVAEIGINHNGDIGIAKKLVIEAYRAGCDAVKFQKRTVDIVYSKQELERPRESVFGKTNGDLKRGLEFGLKEYKEIDNLCRELGIDWFGSPWDIPSAEFLLQFAPPYLKIASACITDRELLEFCASSGVPLIVSTGMCDMEMIRTAVDVVYKRGGTIAYLYHCTSTYPTEIDELNLLMIPTLKSEFTNIPIGYSGHEVGVPTTIMAIALGAESIERHFTLNRAMWGSDQAASLEPAGMKKVVTAARAWEKAKGTGKKVIYRSELPVMKKLRRRDTL